MALFGFGKDKQKEGGDPSVMAYLEDGMRVKCPAMLIDPKKNEIPANITSIQESAGTINLHLHANLIAEKGAKATLILIMDNMRIGGTTKLQEIKPGNAVIEIPASFELMERRKKQRAKINPREGTTVMLLTGLFDGFGITGLADNMSEDGVRLQVVNCIEIKSEKKINITGRTLQAGQIFPIVKIQKIPKVVATLECGGKMVYCGVTSGNTFVGMTFEEMKGPMAQTIGTFVSSRSNPPPTSLPPRARRQAVEPGLTKDDHKDDHKDGHKDDQKDDQKQDTKKDAVAAQPEVAAPVAETAAVAPAPHSASAPTAVTPAQVQPAAPTAEATQSTPLAEVAALATDSDAEQPELPTRPAPTPLQKIKRKGRTVVLFGTEESTLTILEKLLIADGYGKVCSAQSMDELLEAAPAGGAGLILIDLDMPLENCLAIAGSISAHLESPTPLVLVSEKEQISVGATLDAQKAGISLLLPRPLNIDDALFSKLEEVMGIRV